MGLSYDVTGSFAMSLATMAAGLVVTSGLLSFVLVYERRVRRERNRKALLNQAGPLRPLETDEAGGGQG